MTSATEYPVFYRTYSRRENQRRESWVQTVRRSIVQGLAKIGKLTSEEMELVTRMCTSKVALPAGRWLWVGGTAWIEIPGNWPGAFNCHNSHMRPSDPDAPWGVLGYLMELAMMGCGVGRVCSLVGAAKFPVITRHLSITIVGNFGDVPKDDRTDDTIYRIDDNGRPHIIVGDSRKGWADAYQALMEIASDGHPIADFTQDETIPLAINISNVRPSGERLAGFGGVANPIKLPDLFGRVAKILNHAVGRRLTPLELALISDEAALVIVAGNVRRCLPADALVHIVGGSVPICDVQIGDMVHTPIGPRPVTDKFYQGIQRVYQVEVASDRPAARATLNHRMAVADPSEPDGYRWVEVGKLATGDCLLSPDAGLVGVIGVGGSVAAPTYDIEVEDAHCFYADGYLTHNSAGMVQLDEGDTEQIEWLGVSAQTAKRELWVQGDDGWRIDPRRTAMRMSNHTIVFMRKPTRDECINSVRSQYYSGEGAIQYAPEEIARANRDLLDTPEKHRGFLKAIERGSGEAIDYLQALMDIPYSQLLMTTPLDGDALREELDHRIERYGLNPCFGAGTMILTRELVDGDVQFPKAKRLKGERFMTDAWVQKPIESLIGKTVEVFDGERWLKIDNFRITGRNQPMLRIELHSGQSVRTTEYHDFVLADGTRKQARDLEVGDRLLHMPDDESLDDLGLFYSVYAVTPDGVDDLVYCCTVPTTHQITLGNGLITGQCGEATGSDFFCNLSTVCLNLIDPLDFATQRDAFRAAGLFAATLLQRGFDHPRYQYSRDIDPIVLVSFTGGFDFFVNALGVDWLRWWEAGRPDWWISREAAPRIRQVAHRLDVDVEGYAVPDWDDNEQEINTSYYQIADLYQAIEAAYLTLWRSTAEQTIWEYCDRHGLRRPNRCTGLKPEGTLSLLTGASCGWHPPKAARFIRRITFAKDDPVALACLDYGYSVVPAQSDKDENGNLLTDPFDPRCTEWLVEIPIAVNWADLSGADTIAIEKFSALAQFDFWMQVQRHYSTHSTSATIELREDEIEPLGDRIYQAIQNDEGYISTALLARFDNLQTFPRLPFEPISREEFDRLSLEVLARRISDDFHALLLQRDQQATRSVDASEQGPAGCDSDKCLLPERV